GTDLVPLAEKDMAVGAVLLKEFLAPSRIALALTKDAGNAADPALLLARGLGPNLAPVLLDQLVQLGLVEGDDPLQLIQRHILGCDLAGIDDLEKFQRRRGPAAKHRLRPVAEVVR